MSASKVLLERLIQIIDEKTAAVPKPSSEGYNLEAFNAYHRAAEKILDELVEEEAAKIGKRFDGTALKMAGISTSSTSGAWGALSNWKNKAQKHIDEGRAL